MNKELFKENSPGRLQKINIQDSTDWAFIPNPLPQEWTIPTDLWPLLLEAREELARLDGVGRHMPDYKLLLKPLQQREALRSSSLEGTYATPEQLLLFEIDPKEPKSENDPVNTWKEVYNYRDALEKGQMLLEKIPVSIRLIKELHKTLLSGVRGYQRDPGNFRRSQVHIGSDRRFIPPPPQEAVKCLNELEIFIHTEKSIDSLIFCYMVHYQFETIHPFLDGNGRVGRLLLSLMIYKFCNLTSPWLYLSSFFDEYKDEYINSLFNVSAKSDWKNWIAYCLRATAHQAKDAIRRFDKLVDLKDKYFKLVSGYGGNIRLYALIEKLFGAPITTIPQASKLLNVSYPTARNDIDILLKSKILSDSSLSQRPKFFFSPDIIKIAYSNLLDDES